MKKQNFQEPGQGMQHVALQEMALALKPFSAIDLRIIYERHHLRLAPIQTDCNEWGKKKWIKRAIPIFNNYTYESRTVVTPKYWSEIVRGIAPERVGELMGNHKYTKNEKLFLQAFLDYIHGNPYEESVRSLDWTEVMSSNQAVVDIVFCMATQPENADFLKYVDPRILVNIYTSEFLNYWVALFPRGDNGTLQKAFFENTLIDEHYRVLMKDSWLYDVEFLHTGDLGGVLARMTPESYYHLQLLAIGRMHDGDYPGALQLFSQALKKTGLDAFDEPLSNFAYAVALGLSDSPKARSAATKLMKSRKKREDPVYYPMLMALHHYLNGDAAEFCQQYPLVKCNNSMGQILAVLFIGHYQIIDKEYPGKKPVEEWVSKCDYNYIKALFANEVSLLPPYTKKQRWELVIDQLMAMSQGKEKKAQQAAVNMERVVYMVSMDSYEVQPKLQKSKDGGVTWSKGRNMALKTFQECTEDYMTMQDRQVANMVKMYTTGWYDSTSYDLSGIEVIAALAGCPRVFTMRTEQQFNIVEEPLQLMVNQSDKGYTVKSNVDFDNIKNGIYLERVGDRQATVVKVNSTQRKTLALLSEINCFPKESRKQLTALLQGLSQDFTVMSPLLKNAAEMKHVEANPQIAVQISPLEGQMYNIALAVKPFGSCPPYQRPGKGLAVVSTTIDGERVQTERDLDAEQKNLKSLLQVMETFDDAQTDENQWCLTTGECLQLLETLRTATAICFVEWPQGVRMRVTRPLIGPGNLSLRVSSAGQWFEVEGDVKIGDNEKMKIAELMEKLRTATGNFIRLSDDEYIALSDQLRRQLQAIDKMLLGRGKELKVATMNGFQLTALEEMGVKVKADEPFRQLMQRIAEAGTKTFPLPGNIHAELRSYQVEGYQWMSRLAHWGAGACLADDMGLGKTLQAITLMQSRTTLGPQLVILPTSLLHNWIAELARFAPALTAKPLNPQGTNRQEVVSTAGAGDIVLATYGLLVTEGELLAQRTWTTIVLDEAHTIKNRDTQTSKAAMKLTGDFRLMLTGTPLQNHLNEIWNIFQFANPGLLGSYQQFTERFILPIERDHDQERQRLLRRLLSPFLLRRTKDDVLDELPEKTEITLRVELSPDEQALYDNLRQQAIANLEEDNQSVFHALAEITRLRQAACHPRLVNPKLKLKSSKTEAFLNLVDELCQSNHRALVFSQFTSHLALIREELDERGIGYLYLDGSTSTTERNRLVQRFQTGSEPLFLISLKAGGLGLNLTAADYVIHLDPWWNPAVEDQASDRAHRIGQERPVTVYRLIAAGTIEEKIVRLHHNKRSLADALLEDADLFSQITADEVLRLLREGAETT